MSKKNKKMKKKKPVHTLKANKKITKASVPKKNTLVYKIIILIISPIFFFLLLELLFNISGIGYDTNFLYAANYKDSTYYINNMTFTRRFFPPTLIRPSSPIMIKKEKPDDIIRVVVLGASAAQGDPEPSFGFSRVLHKLLNDYYDLKFEVINASITAINSNVVTEIARDCKVLQPDYLVVYLGNNEVIGPFGPGTIFNKFFSTTFLIEFIKWLQTLKTIQLIQTITTSVSSTSLKGWGGLKMFMEQKIQPDDPRLKHVYKTFEHNLQKIINIGNDVNAGVILCTVGTNLRDNAPFYSMYKKGITPEQINIWKSHFNNGRDLYETKDYENAIIEFKKAEQEDNSYADLNFLLGRCHEMIGNFKDAYDYYVKAKDFDTLRFRTDSSLNNVIRLLAEKNNNKNDNVRVADVYEKFNEYSAHNIPGNDLFVDHVHMNLYGNYVAAQTIFSEIKETLSINDNDSVKGPFSFSECRAALAWTDWEELQIYQKILERFYEPPFTLQLNNEKIINDTKNSIIQLNGSLSTNTQSTVNAYVDAINKAKDDYVLRSNYGIFLLYGLNKADTALEQFKIVKEGIPFAFSIHVKTALAYTSLKMYKQAEKEFFMALKYMPYSIEAHMNIAATYGALKDFDKAFKHFEIALQLKPDDADLHFKYAEVLESNNKKDMALEEYKKAVYYNPKMEKAHTTLGYIYVKQKDYENALKHFEEVIKIDPHFIEILNNIAFIKTRMGDIEGAISIYYNVLEKRKDLVTPHYNLAQLLLQKGQLEKALIHLKTAYELDPSDKILNQILAVDNSLKD